MSDDKQPQKAYQLHSTQTKQSMKRLQLSMRNYLCAYLAYRRPGSLDSSRFNNLDWRKPGQQELEAVSFIKNEMKEVLQQQSSHGRETLQMELLMDVFKQLWAYFLLNQRNEAQGATPASQHCDQEWRDSSWQNEICKELDSSNFQNLRRILDYLKKRTIRRSQSRNAQTNSYDEDKALEELDRILR